jgi:hypothetical protein
MPDGSAHKLFNHISGDGTFVTRDFWVYDKNTATLKLPTGVVYTFGKLVNLPGGEDYLYATRIEDPFGNFITITYMAGAGEPADGIDSIVQNLGSQTRTVTFATDGNATRKSIGAMSYGSRTWTYAHTNSNEAGYSLLTGVTPPVGPSWGYRYVTTGATQNEMDRVTTPAGGTITYDFGEETFYLGSTVPVRSRALKTRMTGGRDVPAGTWTYDYAYGTSENQTLVATPCGELLYTFSGVGGFSGTLPVWQVGLLAQRDTRTASNTVLEREAQSWLASVLISNDVETVGQAQEVGIRVPLPDVRAVTRFTSVSNRTYEIDNDYKTTNYNDYGRPWQVVETGELSRTTTRTFDYAFTPYIRDRVASETVSMGTESFTRSYEYRDSDGFQQSENVYGIPRTFTPGTRGNVASVTDGENKITSFTYDWGVVKNTVTPKYTITRVINSDGTVHSETRGGATTTFVYDDLMRLRQRQPPSAMPAANITHTSYDNADGAWTEVQRGPNAGSWAKVVPAEVVDAARLQLNGSD